MKRTTLADGQCIPYKRRLNFEISIRLLVNFFKDAFLLNGKYALNLKSLLLSTSIFGMLAAWYVEISIKTLFSFG